MDKIKYTTYVRYTNGGWVCDGTYYDLEEAYNSLNSCCANGGNGKIETNTGMILYRAGSESLSIPV